MWKSVINSATSFRKDESGATAIEYGLIAGIISIAIVGSLGLISSSLSTTFTDVSGGFD